MKKLLTLLIFCLLITGQILAQTRIHVIAGEKNRLELNQNSRNGFSVQNSVASFEIQLEKMFNKGYVELISDGYGSSFSIGNPDLPVLNRLIEVPFGAVVEVHVISYDESVFNLFDYDINMQISPSQESVSKSDDPATIAFKKNEDVYQTNKFFSNSLARYHDEGIMRGVRLGRLEISPFAYNPVTNELKVYNNLKVEIKFKNGDYAKTESMKKRYYSPAFNGLYTGLFNYTPTREDLTFNSIPMHFVIISNRIFEETLAPFVAWKKKQGFKVTLRFTDEEDVGNTTTSIKNYLQGLYTNDSPTAPAPAFIAMVGDVSGAGQVPTYSGTAPPNSPHPTDLYYTTYDGPNDIIPDVFIGRMSAQTVAHLEAILYKTLLFEKFEMADPSYLANSLTIAGYDANYAQLYGNGALNYMAHYLNADHGINPTAFYHPSNSQQAGVLSALNNGVSIGVYTAHCSEDLWDSPRVNTGHIHALTNSQKYGLLIGNCCLSAKFDYNECFGEAVIRAVDKGGVGYIGGSESTYWSEDYWWVSGFGTVVQNPQIANFGVGSFDAIFHEHGEPVGSRAITGSQMNVAGLLAVNQSNSSYKKYYWEIYQYLGDPTLMPYMGPMPAMNPAHLAALPLGLNELTIDNLAPDSYVALTDNGELKAAGFADSEGHIVFEFEPFTQPTIADLVATTTFYRPYFGTIEIIPAEGAYVVPNGYNVPGEDILTYISTNTDIEIILKNVGIEATAGTLNVSISCDDPQLTLNTTSATCGTIAPDGTATAIFNVTVDNSIEDNKSFSLNVAVSDGSKASWESKLTLKAFAPKFSLDKVLINGSENGNLAAGSMATITTVVTNKGGANAYNVNGGLQLESEYITLACDESKRATVNLEAGESMNFDFYVITDANMPYGYEEFLGLLLTANYGISYNNEFKVSNSGADNYCSSGNQDCSDGDKFASVILYKTSEPSVLLINNTNTNCSGNGYQDFTNTIFPIEPGENYTIKVKKGTGNYNNYVRGWFDFNGNNTFDSNEQLINNITVSNPSTEGIQSFTVPQDFVPGTHRFRLVIKFSSAPTSACNNSNYGQTHDYTFTVPELYARVQNVEAELTGTAITTTWEAPAEGTPTGYNIYRNNNKLNSTPLTDLNYTEEDITEGVYVYNVTAVYEGNKESYSEMSNIICNFIPCEPPVNVEIVPEGKNVMITWEDSDAMEGEFLGYNIYRNGIKINDNLIVVKEYNDENLPVGTYNYKVSSEYGHCEAFTEEMSVGIEFEFCEPPVDLQALIQVKGLYVHLVWGEPVNIDGILLGYNVFRDDEKINEAPIPATEFIDDNLPSQVYAYQVSAVYEHCESELTEKLFTEPHSINETQTSSFNLFPNPTNGNVTISGNGLNHVEIFDIQGRILVEQHAESSMQNEINVSHLQDGIYFVKIFSDAGDVVVRRLVIIK